MGGVGKYKRIVPTPSEKLFKRVTFEKSGCWLWHGNMVWNGYGYLQIGAKTQGNRRGIYAHRLAYELFVGPIPVGKELDHLCRIRNCVNPAHLEAVTHLENVRRGDARKSAAKVHGTKTHCKHGHPFDEKNTHWRLTGGRTCRTCARLGFHRRKVTSGANARTEG